MKKNLFSVLAVSFGIGAMLLNANVVSGSKRSPELKVSSVLKVYALEDVSGSGDPGSGEMGGKGWGYYVNQVKCSDEYSAIVATQVNTGSGAGVHVNAGGIIPGTAIKAGVEGYYHTEAGSSTIYTNKREAYRDECLKGYFWDYCGGAVSCRVLFD